MRLNVPITLRWSDLDAYGHVNNAEMLRLLEEARIVAFWSPDPDQIAQEQSAATVSPAASGSAVGSSTAVLDGRPGADTLTLIARQEIEYLLPVPYLRKPLDVQLWLGRLGGASLEVCYEVWSPIGTVQPLLYTKAATTIVLVDASSQRPRRINDVERAAWEPYLDKPVQFGKRSSH
jgi:acyl-CoA thioester hydrolase